MRINMGDAYRLKLITKEQLLEYFENKFKEIHSDFCVEALVRAVQVVRPNLRRNNYEKVKRGTKKRKR